MIYLNKKNIFYDLPENSLALKLFIEIEQAIIALIKKPGLEKSILSKIISFLHSKDYDPESKLQFAKQKLTLHLDNCATNNSDKILVRSLLGQISRILQENKELKEKIDNMKELVHVCELTKLYNYRFLQEMILDEISRAARSTDYISIIMLDIDNFKSINDNWGHLCGDAVLRDVAKTIKKSIFRKYDKAFRYGGEEFTVLLPKTNLEQAVIIAERIRTAINNYSFHYKKFNFNKEVTISGGIAICCDYQEKCLENIAEKLILEADTNLLQAKKLGKNRIYHQYFF